ncbi:BA14K family protein [Rhodoplanes sp. Z2-YC6860]|uniref:BA14K family protein n=1 Tax=Rhodoplanes sp. Z2-YC6860 TaxID=674703 RepID=UPI00078B1769|nr:BA14K family protein [Rhodoplanes sp. Z2-YC6860]AMN41392.1 hypothetical protein RHPLAN_29550 [Rhodoplanes sp. Z2-YC6860]
MTGHQASRPARKILTRVLATGALLGVYLFNTVAMTGVVMTSSVSPAMARGRGRGGWDRGRGRGRGGSGVGVGIGLGIAAGVIGGAIAADAARRNNAVDYCMQRYRTYNPNTGTYFAAPGVERPCP